MNPLTTTELIPNTAKHGRSAVDVNANAPERTELIIEHLAHVRHMARRLHQRIRSLPIDDLVSSGTVGLIQAVDRFDKSKGNQFRTYASHRIQGAMLDFVRAQCPVKRNERQRRRAEAADGVATDHKPVTISLDGLSPIALNIVLARSTTGPPEVILRSELNQGRKALLPQEHKVITMLYDQGWNGEDVAAAMGLSSGRISCIRRNAVAKLRIYLCNENRSECSAGQMAMD